MQIQALLTFKVRVLRCRNNLHTLDDLLTFSSESFAEILHHLNLSRKLLWLDYRALNLPRILRSILQFSLLTATQTFALFGSSNVLMNIQLIITINLQAHCPILLLISS